ncbi:Cytochrome P450 9e2 [Gryllus bimaculatus]|nr:Cytochrome P450 9e2 [Gryllus bimaculatus]
MNPGHRKCSTSSTFSLRATVFDWALLGAVALVLLWVAGTWNYDFFARRGVAYSRPRLPFVGNTISGFLGITTFPDMLQEMHDISKGHAIYGWFQNQNPFYLVTDPELLKHIAVKDFDHFTDHREIVKGEPDPIFNKNLFLLKGIKSKPLETDMKNLFSRVANDVIGTVAFGIGCDSLKEPENEFYQRGKTLSSFSVKRMVIFFFYLIIPKIMKTIQERQKKGIFRPDMLQLLMQARDGQLKVEEEDKHETEKTGAAKQGQRLALMEVKLALIHLFYNFDLTPSSKTKHPMQYDRGFNTSIKGGFWNNLVPRETTT